MAQPVTVRPSATPRPRGPVVYPSDDDVAESLLHLDIRTLLRAITQIWLAERGVQALTLSDQFVYWVEGDPKQTLTPDLLVIPGESPTRSVTCWKTWEEEHEPTFAVEIVSEDIDKDYADGPRATTPSGCESAPARRREVLVDGKKRVRLATDPHGTQLVWTPAEAANAAAAAAKLEEEIERKRAKLRGE